MEVLTLITAMERYRQPENKFLDFSQIFKDDFQNIL